MANATRPVLVIGSLNMDLVARCARLPAKGQTVFGSDFFTAPGGKGANQAVAAALTAGLRAAGVGTENVLTADGPTGTALITIDAEGTNTIVVISGANGACD